MENYKLSYTASEINEKLGQIGASVPAIQTAEVGQVIAVKAVDENGKPTEWEAVAAGGGSNGDIVIVTISQETMKLSHTPAEILSLLQAGKIVLCSATHAGFTCDSDGKSATTVAIVDAFGAICVVKYAFDESGTMSSSNMYKVSVTEK